MDLNEYLLTVVCAACVGIAADILNNSLSERHKGLEKYIKFGITLCIASCMIIPLISVFGNMREKDVIPDDRTYTPPLEDESLYILEKECGEELSAKIFGTTGINPVSVSIKMKMEDGIPVISKAEIVIPEGSEKKETVSEIISESLGTDKYTVTER